MSDTSKSLPQRQPSTLEIVMKAGQMDFGTAIARLEQAVTKAYGNIDRSINSKQGMFNQALLKTVDHAISESSERMDQFYTNAFNKIYAMDTAVMEQQIQKNAMAAAQKDLERFRNCKQLFENQQRAFGDINVALQQIIEKMSPLTPEQKIVETSNFATAHGVDYKDVALYQRFTGRHNVSKAEANSSFVEIQKNLFNNRDTEDFDKNPLITALIKNNSKLLEKLKNTSNISDFILLLIENISKAYENKNQDIINSIPDFLKKPGILSTFFDKKIRMPTQQEIKDDPNIENNNIILSSVKSVSSEQKMYNNMVQTGILDRLTSVNDANFLVDLSARLNFYNQYTKKDDQDYLQKYRNNPSELVKNKMADYRKNAYDKEVTNDSAFTFLKTILPGGIGDGVVDLLKQGDKGILDLYIHYSNSADDINKPFQNTKKQLSFNQNTQNSYSHLSYPAGVFQPVYKKEEINRSTVNNEQKILVNILKNIQALLHQKYSIPLEEIDKGLNKFLKKGYSSRDFDLLQNNRRFQASYFPSLARQGVTVHNNNKFITTINGDNRNPQTMYNNFSSSVSKTLSNLTSDAINMHMHQK